MAGPEPGPHEAVRVAGTPWGRDRLNLFHPYRGVRAVLATMHRKEAAIAPALARALGMIVEAGVGIDTDALGTFSGGIPRIGTMGEVAVRKARLGMAAAGLRLGLASEGSFGPHPLIPLVAAGMELLVLVDDERGFTVSESLVTDRTNYGHALSRTVDDLDGFLARSRFPSHALMVAANKGKGEDFKGVSDRDTLVRAVAVCAAASEDGLALTRTDMRAHMNPTRMASLHQLAQRMAARLVALCDACGSPGFGRVGIETGLPCAVCDTPTDLVLADILGCARCDARVRRPRANAPLRAGPADCPSCNP